MEIGGWVNADQVTGRIIHIPNGKVFRESQANYTQAFPYIWDELPVLVTFESNWQKAKELLLAIAEQHALHLSKDAEVPLRQAARRFLISYGGIKPEVYTSIADSGVLLAIRYMCDPRSRRRAAETLGEHILIEFGRHADIDLAYPTQRMYWNAWEGKPGARAGDVPEGWRTPPRSP
jgi:small-conductance mechanosensitive channel